MRSRAFRRHQANRHMMRRLKEDRNQHYDQLTCPCFHDPRAMARFKEQPALCSGPCCGNPRRWFAERTMQEQRNMVGDDGRGISTDRLLKQQVLRDVGSEAQE